MVARLVATSARAASSTVRVHARTLATVSSSTIPPVSSGTSSHKVVVVGGGAGGLSASHQLLRSGKYTQDEIAVIDPAAFHHYQPGWTLVGGGLKNKEDLKMSLPELVDPKLKLYSKAVETFAPEQNEVTLADGSKVSYEQLIVAPGIQIKYDAIKGLPEALADPSSKISTIYGYDTCDKTFRIIEQFSKGKAIFTQPAGMIKCAGAPQKALWLALDHWKKAGRYNPASPESSDIQISFATGLPVMFGVAKYSQKLNELREERGVEGLFQHDLVEINGDQAVFALADGSKITKKFDLLHAVPKMGAYAFVAKSPLADAAGLVEVNKATLQHTKYANVWSLGDASSLPTSKTAAAITAQTPVLVENLINVSEGKQATAEYDGYASCPLTTEYGKVLLAEFKYDLIPKETFGKLFGIDQAIPRKSFYHLKKDFFPWVYKNYMVKGTWGGPKGFLR